MKAYLINLGKYNEGESIGNWLTLPYEEEELESILIQIKVATMTDGKFSFGYIERNQIYEEFAIHGFESDNGIELEISEYERIERVNNITKEIVTLEIEELEILKAFIGLYNNNLDNVEMGIEVVQENKYIIYHDCNNPKDLGYTYMLVTNQLDGLSNEVKKYVDFKKIGSDIMEGGTFVQMESKYIEFIH